MCQDFSWYRPEASLKILKSPAAGSWRQQRPHAAGRGAGPRAAGQRPRAGGIDDWDCSENGEIPTEMLGTW